MFREWWWNRWGGDGVGVRDEWDCVGMGFVLLGVGMEWDWYEVFEWNMVRLKERRVGGFVLFESVDM